jgi:beta-ureidopropionase / N-carbamoyl-L-amino-acid hydrolase
MNTTLAFSTGEIASRVITTTACLVAGLFLAATSKPCAAASSASDAFHIDGQRLEESLKKLSEFGRNADGGVTRLGFSEADLAAREYITSLMRSTGLTVRTDAAGNLFGHRDGSKKLPIILFGSHIDSVLHGGNFDGDVGSMGAIEVMRALHDGKIKTQHPMEAVIWANEEGNHFGVGTLGSGVAAGSIGREVLLRKDEQGLSYADWLGRYGQNPDRLLEARIPRGSLAAYVELHIEQGPYLDEQKIPIGVVQGIVGLRRLQCNVSGVANHAGTTPMNRRHDALAAASKAILAVREVVRSDPGRQVGTVGYLKVEPGAINVIPGLAEYPVELRDMDAAKIDRMWEAVKQKIAQIDQEEGVATSCKELEKVEPAIAVPMIQDAVRAAATALHLQTTDLPSAAVQDAQQIARIAPMGMIFVPSKDGVSHSPKEYTAGSDVRNGAEVLYRTLITLDREVK